MKRFFGGIIGTTILSACALAQEGLLGTKPTESTPYSAAGTGSNLVQMVVAVVIVFALIKWALPKLLSKISGRLTTGLNSQIRLEESASFPGGTLQVVTVRGRVLLLGLGGGNICTLADLGPAIVNDPGPTFSEYLEQVPDDKPVVKAVVNTPTEELEDDDSVEALRRIKDLLNPR